MACHSKPFDSASRAYLLFLLTVGGIGLLGCSNSVVDMAVHPPNKTRRNIDQNAASKGLLSLPADDTFNYSTFRSGQQGASATGSAQAVAGNGARCRAVVSGDGTAWGSFQFGYSFDNVTDHGLNAEVKVKMTIRESASYKEGTNAVLNPPEISGNIFFFIKDTNGIVSVKESLVAIKRDRGMTSSTDQKNLILNTTFEPQRGYYLVITGRAEVKTTDSQSAEAALEVTDVSMEIQWHNNSN